MYNYSTERPKLFTEEGSRMFIKIRDRARELFRTSGAATCGSLIRGVSGDSWTMLACVDRLVELGEIKLVYGGNDFVATQNWVYVCGTLMI